MSNRRQVAAWVLYDWAYGAFTTIVATFVVPAYFTQAVAIDPATGTAQWAAMQAGAGLVIAAVALPLGAVADRGGSGRGMLGVATAIMAVATGLLWFVRPHAGDGGRALALAATATVAFEVALIFYNAMLPALRPGRLGRLSMLAWGAGYAGGLAALAICLVGLVLPAVPPWGLSKVDAEPVRACALLAAGWVALFGWPVAVFGPRGTGRASWAEAVRHGLTALRPLLAAVWEDRVMRRFVLARLFTTDGLVTLFAFGGIYAAGQFGLSTQGVLLFGIGLTVTAGLGVLAAAGIEDRIGARETMLVSVLALAGLSSALLLVGDRTWFWALGLTLGLFVGPAQAAARSFMARAAPPDQVASYFGLLALSGRATAFAGPLVLAVVTALTGSQRAGMGVIVVFLAIGAALLRSLPPTSVQALPRVPV